MKLPQFLTRLNPFLFLLMCSSFCLWAEDHAQQDVIAKGVHGGRVFTEGNIALELLIFEQGMPPHFRAYLYENGKLMAPNFGRLMIQLKRFNGKADTISFVAARNFLQSEQVISEPHSFDVSIQLDVQKSQLAWHYSSYEGRVTLVPAMLKAADIQINVAKSEKLKKQLKVVGKIVTNRDTLAPIYARYAGIIKTMTKNLGDEVTKGELLVTIESNESLQNYNIMAPMTGTIVQKHVTQGELAQTTKPIYEVANLTNVWADFTLYRKEAPKIKKGMPVRVTGDEGTPQSISTITYIAPLGVEDSQTTLARAVLPNDDRVWLPGMYVNAVITIHENTVPVAVLLGAIQHLRDQEVVFVQQGDIFEATPVTLGEKDDQWVEVTSGLDAGQRYVCKNSFFLKAELGKEGASHEH